MSVTAEALRELHRIHRQLADLRSRLAQGPKQIQLGETTVKRLEEEYKQAKENAKQARIAVDAKQLQLRQREARIADLKGKLNACGSNREYQALKEQIAADEQANRVLEDEILEALEGLDVLQAKIGEGDQHLKRAQNELAAVRQRISEQQQSLEEDLARVTGNLEQSESALPADFRREYQRIAKVRGEEALAQVEGGVCGGCYQTLTTQMLNELRMERLVFCKSCGCLLYLPEKRTP